MSTIHPTITDEAIEKGRKAREGHHLRVVPVHCTCGWKSDTYIEADGLPRFEAHLVELALEAAAPIIAAQALRDARDAVILELLGLLHAENDASALEMGPLEACETVEEWLDARAALVGGDDE